jgi:hypothetical protein
MSEVKVESMNVLQRIHYAAGLMSGRVKKDGENKEQKFPYVSHDAAVDHVREAYQKARIVMTMTCHERTVEHVEVELKYGKKTMVIESATYKCTIHNIDKPDDFLTVDVPAIGMDFGDKSTGKAISYAKKYAILAMTGALLATGMDSDQETHEMPAPAKKTLAAVAADTERVGAKRALWDAYVERCKADGVEADKDALEDLAFQTFGFGLSDCNAKELNTLTARVITNNTTKG